MEKRKIRKKEEDKEKMSKMEKGWAISWGRVTGCSVTSGNRVHPRLRVQLTLPSPSGRQQHRKWREI